MFKRLIASLVCITFSFTNLQYAHAQTFSVNQLPVPGTMVGESVPFAPLALKGLIVNPQKPLEFQFIVDTGRGPQDTATIKDQANLLVKYFLAGLTIPEKDLWVNLSPYEKNKMVPAALGQTDLGRDLLAQDYILKQLTASLIYPEKSLGKEFWSRVYAKAQQQFGTTNVPVNTFNKVWILPDQAQVYENVNAAYVTKSTLKVMLDEDYLALKKHTAVSNGTDSIGSQIVRQIILPEITKEVNTGKNFAPLRQIYQALILAKWYKETIQNALLDSVYINKDKVRGVNVNDPKVKEEIYERYLKAYKKGAFNYIKEDPTPDGQVVPRKYFSGGITKLEPDKIDRSGRQADVKSDGAMISLTVGLVTAGVAGIVYANRYKMYSTTKLLELLKSVEKIALYSVPYSNKAAKTYNSISNELHRRGNSGGDYIFRYNRGNPGEWEEQRFDYNLNTWVGTFVGKVDPYWEKIDRATPSQPKEVDKAMLIAKTGIPHGPDAAMNARRAEMIQAFNKYRFNFVTVLTPDIYLAIRKLEKNMLPYQIPENLLMRFLNTQGVKILVVTDPASNEIIGYVFGLPQSSVPKKSEWVDQYLKESFYVMSRQVLPKYQDQGIGSAMRFKLMIEAIKDGYKYFASNQIDHFTDNDLNSEIQRLYGLNGRIIYLRRGLDRNQQYLVFRLPDRAMLQPKQQTPDAAMKADIKERPENGNRETRLGAIEELRGMIERGDEEALNWLVVHFIGEKDLEVNKLILQIISNTEAGKDEIEFVPGLRDYIQRHEFTIEEFIFLKEGLPGSIQSEFGGIHLGIRSVIQRIELIMKDPDLSHYIGRIIPPEIRTQRAVRELATKMIKLVGDPEKIRELKRFLTRGAESMEENQMVRRTNPTDVVQNIIQKEKGQDSLAPTLMTTLEYFAENSPAFRTLGVIQTMRFLEGKHSLTDGEIERILEITQEATASIMADKSKEILNENNPMVEIPINQIISGRPIRLWRYNNPGELTFFKSPDGEVFSELALDTKLQFANPIEEVLEEGQALKTSKADPRVKVSINKEHSDLRVELMNPDKSDPVLIGYQKTDAAMLAKAKIARERVDYFVKHGVGPKHQPLSPLDAEYLRTLYEKLLSGRAELRIGETLIPSAYLTSTSRQKRLGVIDANTVIGNKEYLKTAKTIQLRVIQMNGGLGTGYKRQRIVERLTGRTQLSAKSVDSFWENLGDVGVDEEGKPKTWVSVAELKLRQYMYLAKKGVFGHISVQELVNDESKGPIEKFYDQKPYSVGKSFREIFNTTRGLDLMGDVIQGVLPVVDPNTKEFIDDPNATAPGGHGFLGTLTLERISAQAPTGKNNITTVVNGDGVNNFLPPDVAGWMIREKIPIVMITTTRTSLDIKGGIVGLESPGELPSNIQEKIAKGEELTEADLGDTALTPQLWELAQAKTVGQVSLFQQLGISQGEQGGQLFNTNLAAYNENLLHEFLHKLRAIIGDKEFFAITTPDMIANPKDKEIEGVKRKVYQIEGAMGSALLNLNKYIMTTKDPRVKALKEEYNINRLVYFLNFGLQKRTEVFTPEKYPWDHGLYELTGMFKPNLETGRLEKIVQPGEASDHLPGFLFEEKGFYSDYYNVIRAWGHPTMNELTLLGVKGKVLFTNAVLKGNVFIDSKSEKEINLNEFKERFSQTQDGRLILKNIYIQVGPNGEIDEMTPINESNLAKIKSQFDSAMSHTPEKQTPDATMSSEEAAVAENVRNLVIVSLYEGREEGGYDHNLHSYYATEYSAGRNEKAFEGLKAIAKSNPSAFTKANWDLLQAQRRSVELHHPKNDFRNKDTSYLGDSDSIKTETEKIQRIVSEAEEIFKEANPALKTADNAMSQTPKQETTKDAVTIVDRVVARIESTGGYQSEYSDYIPLEYIYYNQMGHVIFREYNQATYQEGDIIPEDQITDKAEEHRDKAALAKAPGGIDLNQINVLRKGKTVNVQFDPAQLNALEQGGFEGFTPVIINITHISSPFQLLGINPVKQSELLAKV